MFASTYYSSHSGNPAPIATVCQPRGAKRTVRLRKLSATGMMGEAEATPDLWTPVEVSLPNIGPVSGFVAWVEGNHFGICFDENIDPGKLGPALH